MDTRSQSRVPLRAAVRSRFPRSRLVGVLSTAGASRPWPRRGAAATGALAIAVTLAACGGALPPPNLRNIPQIQQAIERALLTSRHVSSTAYCPQTVPMMKGEVFSCVVAVHGRAPVIFNVTEANDAGYVTFAGQ